MTERDTDIEFDFFDEPETEEATERVRTPRRQTPRGPRRPVRPPSGLIPMLRLAGLIAFVILAVVLFVVLVRGCASDSKHGRYDSYLSDTRKVAASSTAIGRQLNQALSATGIKESQLEQKLKGLAAQQQQGVAQAQEFDPPGPLRVEHDRLVEVLSLRASGLSRLADAFRQTATAKNASAAGQLIAAQARLLAASDVNWDYYFREPTQQELLRQSITDVGGVPDSEIFPNPERLATRARGRDGRESRRQARERARPGEGVARREGARGGSQRERQRDHGVDRPRISGDRRELGRLPGVQRGCDAHDPEVAEADRAAQEDLRDQRR